MNEPYAMDFHARLNGRFQGMLHWHQLDALWAKVGGGAWYFYQVGEALPDGPLQGGKLAQRLDALDVLLRKEHDYNYCGIVYADDTEQPTLIKVYDPSQLGSSCSNNATPTPPGWILSQDPPELIEVSAPVPNNRRHWWQIFQ